jgi:hypothetical protein
MSTRVTSNIKTYWWLFLIWPALSLFLSIRSRSISPNFLWVFIIFYGLTFVISIDNQDSDITRYIKVFQDMYKNEITAQQFMATLYNVEEEGSTDLLQPILSYATSLFTGNPAVLLALFAVVFGFFYSRNVWLVLDRLEGKMKWLTTFFFICLLLVVPIWNINGFRFWTAAHIFFYGAFTFIVLGKSRGILFVLITALVHFSFLILIVIFLIYLLVGKRTWGYFIFFVLSIFINNLEIKFFNEFAESYIPTIFVQRADSYTSVQALERFQQRDVSKKRWYAVFYKKALFWAVMFSITVLFVRFHRAIRENANLRGLFAFTFLLFGVANLLSVVPSGIRFAIVASLFATASCVLVIHLAWHDRVMKRSLYLTLPLLALFVLVSIREGFNSIGVNTLFSNAFIASFAENKVALIDVFKWRL